MFPLFFLQLKHELLKLLARPRTSLGYGVFLLVETLVIIGASRPRPREMFRRAIEGNGYGFESYFSGLTLGLQMVMWTVFLLGGLFLALVAGDVMSKEVEDGTMRMILCRPASRGRIGVVKYLTCVAYTFSLTFFIGLSALAVGTLYRGVGGLFAVAPFEHVFALYPFAPGLARYLGALPVLGWGLLSFSSVGFMLSCLNMKPAAATIVTLTLFFFDFIFHDIPYFESYKPYFLTTHMSAWLQVFVPHIPWRQIGADMAYLGALDLTFVVVGIVAFTQRDFKG